MNTKLIKAAKASYQTNKYNSYRECFEAGVDAIATLSTPVSEGDVMDLADIEYPDLEQQFKERRAFVHGYTAALSQQTWVKGEVLPEVEMNLKLHKIINFDELVKHGIENGANVVNGMPWSWKINGYNVTHENDHRYIIETIDGIKNIHRGESLIAYASGLRILVNHNTHSPGGCPM